MSSVQEIKSKYEESFQFLQDRKKRQVDQLVLLNNLRRNDMSISSTLLLSLFNRVMSNMYDDKIQAKFLPSQGITQEQVNSYNVLAQSDYLEMNKALLDYDWVWDTLFFGRGYVETIRFDKKRRILDPHVINPLTFGYDPYFEDVQDWRYYWKWLTKSKHELTKLIEAGVIEGITSTNEIPSGIDPYLWDYKVRRDQAKKAIQPAADTINGDVFQILEFYCYGEDGEKYVYWTDRDISMILYKDKLDLKDGEEIVSPDGRTIKTNSKWPIVIKEAYREPHSTVPFSIADLLEDKHRAKSVLLNLAFIAAKDKANPIYLYDPSKVKDVTAFFSRQVNQHIATNDAPADASVVSPLNTQEPMSAGLIQFISMLTQEANEPIGTGMTMQPVKKGKQTATETAVQQQLNDMAQSLQSKVMQFGEQEFWAQWFARYKRFRKEGESKLATVVGVKGATFDQVFLDDFNVRFPPGVMIYSAKEAEYKELVLRRDLMQLYPQLAQNLDPEGMRNFNKHVFFPKFLQDPSLIDILFPKTIDEMKAEEENYSLKEDKLVNVSDTDEHLTHIYTHYQVMPKTWAVWLHLAWHEEYLAKQKKEQQQQAKQGGEGGDMKSPNQGKAGGNGSKPPEAKKPKVGEKNKNPMEAAAPLKNASQPLSTKTPK